MKEIIKPLRYCHSTPKVACLFLDVTWAGGSTVYANNSLIKNKKDFSKYFLQEDVLILIYLVLKKVLLRNFAYIILFTRSKCTPWWFSVCQWICAIVGSQFGSMASEKSWSALGCQSPHPHPFPSPTSTLI